jgi:hypothetical protein
MPQIRVGGVGKFIGFEVLFGNVVTAVVPYVKQLVALKIERFSLLNGDNFPQCVYHGLLHQICANNLIPKVA